MSDRWESDRWESDRTSSRRYDRSYDRRREGRRERDTQFYRRSNRSFGDNWNNDSSTRNYNEDSYGKSNDNSGGTNGLVIYIDSNSVGRLIGKGGSKIKALEEESRAKINVNKILS